MKGRKLLWSELRKGMKVIGGDGISSCWKRKGKIVPFKITNIDSDGEISQQSLDGTKTSTCTCSDRDKLHIWQCGIEDIAKEDEIFSKKFEQTHTILARVEDVVAYTDGAIVIWNTIDNLKKLGFEVTVNEPAIILTTKEALAELSKLKGQTVIIKD